MFQETQVGLAVVSDEARRAAYLENKTALDAAIILAKRKYLILGVIAVAFALTTIATLLLPNYYTAAARLMPPKQSQSIGYSALLGQLSPILSAAGVGADTALRNPSDLYVAMLKSRNVADALLDRFSLVSAYHKQTREDTRKRLASLTEILAAKDGTISISVDDRDPNRAAQIANGYAEELDRLTGTLAMTEASQRRRFFEREVKAASDELAQAEEALKATEEGTGVFQLDTQSKAMIDYLSGLRAQITATEVRIQGMRSFATSANPDLVRDETQLKALRAELSAAERGQNKPGQPPSAAKVPGVGLEYTRRLREVKYRESLFELLAKQYEAARVDEAKDVPTVQVLDAAIPPERKSWPHRGMLIVSVTLLAFFLGSFLAFLLESLRNAREYPEFASRWELLMIHLGRGWTPR